MKSPIPKKYNPDIAARFGDIEDYHATRGMSSRSSVKKSGNQGKQKDMSSKSKPVPTNKYC